MLKSLSKSIPFLVLALVVVGCSSTDSGNAKAPFLGKWYDDAGDIRLSISDEVLTISGSGIEELHSGFDTGGRFSKTMDYEVTKNTDGNDAVEISVGGQSCTLLPVEDSLDFHCYAGTEIFLKKSG
jgi:hypothetical protein